MQIDTKVFERICKEKREIGIKLLKQALRQTSRFSTFDEDYIESVARDAFNAEEVGFFRGLKWNGL